MKADVTVAVSGLTGSGKSAVYGEIALALAAIGLKVEHADPDAFKAECNMTHADWQEALDLYRPTVTLIERNVPRAVPRKTFWRRIATAIRGSENDG